MVSFETSDLKKIGHGLTGFGVILTLVGVFLFNSGFLAVGNVFCFSGATLAAGPRSALQFFMKPENYKGSISLGVGFIFVITGWPIVGIILEAYGFILLFSGLWRTVLIVLRKLPLLGWIPHPSYLPSYFPRRKGRAPV